MNFIDVLLLLMVAGSAVHGLRLGAAVQVMSFGGFWLGMFLGALLAPHVTRLTTNPAAQGAIALVILFGTGLLLGLVGRQIGARVWQAIRRVRLGAADALLGAVVAVIASLLAAWLIASILVNSSSQAIGSQIQGSTIIQALDGILPPAPSVFSRIQAFINSQGFPQVFTQIAPSLAGSVPPASDQQVIQAVSSARQSTVKVEGLGCGAIQEGSGFVVAPNLVVTNAHVVAGVGSPVVTDLSGKHRAVAMLFDPEYDVAVLETASLGDPVLQLDGSVVGRGTKAAVLGYPENGSFTAVPAGVADVFTATGRDIYNQSLTVRQVYQLDAVVRPGNSGGPLVEPNGLVIGVVFSRSTSNPGVGYALTSPGVLQRVLQAESAASPVGTGPCTSG